MTVPIVEARPTGPTVSTDTEALVRRLIALPAGKYQILSCYVRLTPEDRIRASYLIELKDRVKALQGDPTKLALGHDQRVALERDLDRILEYLSDWQGLPPGPGIAIFACEELGLFSAAPLSRVHRTRLGLDVTPWIAELVAAAHEAEPVLAVVVDRAHARFFTVTALEVTELSCLTAASTRGGKFHSDRGDAPGWNEQEYHHRIEHERHRHYVNVVQRVKQLLRAHPYRGFVLAGPRDHISALLRFLPQQFSGRLLGTAKLNPTAVQVTQIRSAVLEVVEEHDQRLRALELAALDEAVGTGWAVSGTREVLRALHRGQARTIFIRGDLKGSGYRCAVSGRLVLSKAECRDEGEPLPVRDLVDEAIEEALRQRVQVIIVPIGDAADAVDGLAATLRFR
jgi:peptide subunit release factor 1 (eRF1)